MVSSPSQCARFGNPKRPKPRGFKAWASTCDLAPVAPLEKPYGGWENHGKSDFLGKNPYGLLVEDSWKNQQFLRMFFWGIDVFIKCFLMRDISCSSFLMDMKNMSRLGRLIMKTKRGHGWPEGFSRRMLDFGRFWHSYLRIWEVGDISRKEQHSLVVVRWTSCRLRECVMFTRLWISYSSWTKSEFFFVISTSKRKEHTQKNRFLVHIGSYRYCIGCSHMVTESSHVNVISFFIGLDQGNIWNPLDSMAKTRVSSWETHRFPMVSQSIDCWESSLPAGWAGFDHPRRIFWM